MRGSKARLKETAGCTVLQDRILPSLAVGCHFPTAAREGGNKPLMKSWVPPTTRSHFSPKRTAVQHLGHGAGGWCSAKLSG